MIENRDDGYDVDNDDVSDELWTMMAITVISQGTVVQSLNNAIYWIKYYPLDELIEILRSG